MMNASIINGIVEFVSIKGEGEDIDDQINNWIKANPDASIIDIKYRMAVYQNGNKKRLSSLALLLFHQEKSGTPKSLSKPEAKPEPEQKTGARTMVMNLRKELDFESQG